MGKWQSQNYLSQTEGAAGIGTKIKLITYTKHVTCCIETIPDDFYIYSYIYLFVFFEAKAA